MIIIWSLTLDKSDIKIRDEKIVGPVWELYDRFEEKGLEKREGQFDLALDISEAIRDRRNLIVEAGVGIGKSLGYLIPSLYTLRYTGKPIVIATSSIALTEQLIGDINQASDITGISVKSVVGKGRRNFSCKDRVLKNIETYRKKSQVTEKENKLMEWVLNSETGDRSHVSFEVSNREWSKVAIHHCLFEKCKYRNECGFYKMRSGIGGDYDKDIIVVNQDLLIEHLLKESESYSNLIDNNHEAIIIDEAHNLENKTRNRLTQEWPKHRLKKIVKELNKVFSTREDYERKLKYKISKTDKQIENMFEDFNLFADFEIDKYENLEVERIEIGFYQYRPEKILELLSEFYQLIQLESVYQESRQDSLIDELGELIQFITNINEKENSNLLFWGEVYTKKKEKKVKVCYAPKDIAKRLNDILFNSKQPVILTSATITQPGGNTQDKYSYQMNTVGYEGDFAEIKKSPFPYNKNGRLYIPNDVVSPNTENKELYLKQVTNKITELITLTKGRTLVLFTAKLDMDYVYDELTKRELNIKLLKQAEGSSQRNIINEFKRTNGVLLSAGTLREGVDIPGTDLSSVIITRLPFPVPDPIISYKTTNSNDPMNDILIPEMIKDLRQGAGRLIRNHNDKGLLTILDSRLSEKSNKEYKHSVLEMLPITNRLKSMEEVKEFVEEKLKPLYKNEEAF